MHNRKLGTKLINGLALVAALSLTVTTVAAQQKAPQPLVVHQLTPNISWVEGAGGNSTVIVGKNGVIVVDTKVTAAAGAELVADIAKITPKPITTAIVTHSDGDHVNGLASFPKGVTIVAQENCAKEMKEALDKPAGAALADHMPNRIVTRDVENMTIDGVHLRLLHFAPAHTQGDLMVYLPQDKIMSVGDIVATQFPYPLIHLEKDGSSAGWITTMRGILATDAVTFIPGHGQIQTRADLEKRLADTIARRDQIKALVAQGKSLEEVRQTFNETPPATNSGSGPNFTDFTGVVYAEVTKK